MKRALFVLLFCAFPARAYVRSVVGNSNLCLWWDTHGHSFQIDAQASPDLPQADAYDAIRRSFQTWASVSCSDLTFSEEPLSSRAQDRLVGFFDGQSNHNLVLFRTRSCRDVVPPSDPCLAQGGCGNAYDCWDQADSIIASTITTAQRSTGRILDADIELNDAPAANGTKFTFTAVDGQRCTTPTDTGCVRTDVQNTVTHEAGHSLGLGHSPDPNATMYDSAPFGQTSKRVLGTDDVNGICAIYPRGAATVSCVPGGGGCGCSQSQTGPGAALAAVSLLLLQIRRRSRRRPQLPIMSSTNPASAPRFQSGSEN